MKTKLDLSFYDTCSTEQAAALMSIGFDLVGKPDSETTNLAKKVGVELQPVRRIFSDKFPPKNGTGIRRGGQVFYRFETSGTEYDNPAQEIADAYADKTPSDVVDETLAALREKTKGTEAGHLVETLIEELPREYARYIRAAMVNRKNLIDVIENEEIPEFVRVQNRHGFFVQHDARMSPEEVKALLDA